MGIPRHSGPLQTLLDVQQDGANPSFLTPELAVIYGGGLSFPLNSSDKERPYVVGNFVSSLDGVVSYGIPGQETGAEISGGSGADRFVMGLLRACAGAVIVGSATVRAEGGPPRTPAAICPEFAGSYRALQIALGRPGDPLQVVLTGGGQLSFSLPIFRTAGVEVVLAAPGTVTEDLKARLPQRTGIQVTLLGDGPSPDPTALLLYLRRERGIRLCLLEGGPSTFGTFLRNGLVDELFLTTAPRIAGRDRNNPRPGFVTGAAFTPEESPAARLLSLKRSGSFLFSRFAITQNPGVDS